ncbi:unnamed protein product [Caenorhabditis bovis]|uniref:Plasminogen receptor (KT) n=1 Tax=Caenorhabditis bovis TaxID=2654633 RepID=A0A8S1EQS5_9PELO|nr:unnamed protein product [Caenorhabditis bovis]
MGQSQGKQADADVLRKYYDEQMEFKIMAENTRLAQSKALERAEQQDRLGWYILGAATTTIVLLAAGSIYKRKDVIIPVVPLIMAAGYQYDIAQGDNLKTVCDEAEKLFKSSDPALSVTPITLRDVDEYRKVHFTS